MTRQLRVFLCHASEDKDVVRHLYQRLFSTGFIDPWLDEEKILPGQNWEYEIKEAARNADVVLVCLSNRSLKKEGFIQREIREFQDRAKEKPEGTIFVIPVKLEPCTPPSALLTLQWVNLFNEAEYQKLFKALYYQSKQLGIDVQESVSAPQEAEKSLFTALDKTMSNPRRLSDAKCLEVNDYNLAAIINFETIFLVVGSGIPAELCDRSVAETVRNEIDSRGKDDRFRRGIIISDGEWLRTKTLQRSPAISIGGPPANDVTKEIEDLARNKHEKRFGTTYVPGPPSRIAIWGRGPNDTARAAEQFLKDPDGLASFLRLCWK